MKGTLFLKAFSQQKSIPMTELRHFLDPIKECVDLPGLYMVLKKDSIFEMNLEQLKRHLEDIESNQIPRLEFISQSSEQFRDLETEYYSSTISNSNKQLPKHTVASTR